MFRRDPRWYEINGHWHPMAEWRKAIDEFKKLPHIPNGKFHNLARKMEQLIPRGKWRSDPMMSELLLEIINEEKLP